MKQDNQDKNYTNHKVEFVMQHPIIWEKIKDCLSEKFIIRETEDKEQVNLEMKENET